MTIEQKNTIMKRLQEVTKDLQKIASEEGNTYFALTVTDDAISIRVYDKAIDNLLMDATWRDCKTDEDWEDFAGKSGWYTEYREEE